MENVLLKENSVFVRKGDYYYKINYSDILWVEASRSYSYLHIQGRSPILVSLPLATVKEQLPAELFMQVHRSNVVNLNHVDAFTGNLLCIGKQKITISKQYRAEVFGRFNFLGGHKRRDDKKE